MTDDAVSADSQAAAVPPIPETEAPDGTQGTDETSQAPSKPEVPKDDDQEFTRTQRNWRALREDRDHWRDMARRLSETEREPEPARPEPKVEAKAKTLADFGYDESQYQDYLFEQAEKRAEAAAERRLQQQEARSAAQRRDADFRAKEAKFAASVDDYEEVAYSARITDSVAEAVKELDDAPQVAYFLGKNPDLARQLNGLSDRRVAIELGKIEERLARERTKAKDKPAVSKTPPPPPKIDAKGDASPKAAPDSAESDNLSTADWFKARNKQIHKRK